MCTIMNNWKDKGGLLQYDFHQPQTCNVDRLQWLIIHKTHKNTFPELMSGRLNSLCGLVLRNIDVETQSDIVLYIFPLFCYNVNLHDNDVLTHILENSPLQLSHVAKGQLSLKTRQSCECNYEANKLLIFNYKPVKESK